MPPKPKQGESENFSDAATLPRANVFKFTLVHKSFLSLEARDKVRQAVKDKLIPTSLGKVISLTRDEIVTYGKTKQYILDASQISVLPQEDPRRQLSEHDMIARSAADRIFELTVLIRRQKAAKPAIIDEEEKKLAEDQVDASIFLVDYPQTRAEILSFSKYSQSLHTVFEIEEVDAQPEINNQDEENNEPKDVKANEIQKTPDSDDQRSNASQIIQAFKSARQDCDARSPLRNLSVLRVAFKNISQTFLVTESDGSTIEKLRTPEDSFICELYAKNIDKYAQYFFQYLRFKRSVETHPLVPDQVVKSKLARLSLEQDRDRKSVESLREISKTLTQGDEDYQKTQQEIANLESKISERVSQSKDLMRRSKKSLDDETSGSQDADMQAYNKDFVNNSETANKVSSILSAMVTHIEQVNKEAHETSQIAQSSPDQRQVTNSNLADESTLNDIFDRYATEIACDLSLMSRGPDQTEAQNQSTSVTQRHSKGIVIHDETNKTLEVEQTAPLAILDQEQERLTQIAEREQEIYSNLLVPGKNRHGMPKVPEKSKRLRDAQNPEFYPFCTLSVDEAERLLSLRAFQQMLKQKGIDEGKSGLGKHTKYHVFERNFENHMSKEIFVQVLADAFLDDPDVAQMYYPRTDSILLALYNRHESHAKSTHKSHRAISADEILPDEQHVFDYEKQWRAKYKIMPDFQNWIAYFADDLIQENEIVRPQKQEEKVTTSDPAPIAGKTPAKPAVVTDAVDPNAIQVTLMRYLIDEESMPKQLFSIEDAKVQSVMQKSAFMYPDDNSVIRVDHYQVGGQNFKKSIVIKDNLKFGLRERADTAAQDVEYGLVNHTPCGDSEFFLHFENGTKLGVEQVKLTRNPQRTIKIPARQMTAEEKAYQNEQKAKLAEATAKALKANKPPPTDIEIPKDPEPTWEKEPLNYLDQLFSDEDIDQSHARMTLTFKNGLIVQYLGSGHIVQIQERSLGQKSGEVSRIVTKEGVVIRQFANRDAELLFPDGVKAVFSRQNLEWTITNNKGLRRSFKDGIYKDLKPMPCAIETDSETGSRMLIREDGVLGVTYKDGSLFVQHQDGTKVHTSADKQEIIIEKFGFASHVIKYTSPKSKGLNDAFGRTIDGIVLETFMPDGTKTQTFTDQISVKKNEVFVYRTLITRQDLSVVLTDSEGHVSIISSNARAALNELGQKTKLGIKDTDYLEELSREYGQFTAQVYQAHINRQSQKSHIKTKNVTDETQFVLRGDLTLDKVKLDQVKTGSASKKEQERQKRKLAKAVSYVADELAGHRIMDLEIEEIGGFQEPHLKYYQTPRLFIINNDGSARELLSQLQLEYALRIKGLQPDTSLKIKSQDVFNNHHVESAFFLTKVINMNQVQIAQQTLNKIDLPENAKEVLQEQAIPQDYTLQLPKQDQYLFSQVFKLPDCDSIVQTSFANDYERYVQWKMEQVRYETEFGIIHAPATKDVKVDLEKIDEDMSDNKRILIRILKHRAQPREKFQSELFRSQAIKEMQQSETVKAFRESGQRQSIQNSLSSSTDKPGFGKKTVKVQSQLERESAVKQSQNKSKSRPSAGNSLKLREKVDQKLNDINQLKQASDFIPEYFSSDAGQEFITHNPQKPPTEEVLLRMKQRLERMNKQNIHNLNGDNELEGQGISNTNDEPRDNPIVALEPDELKQGSRFTGSKRNEKSQIQGDGSLANGGEDQGPVIYPSLYMQEKMYILQKDQEALLKSEEHHIMKTKDFNVYGRLREEKPFVKTIQKSNAQSDLNEKFITTECITDRRIKISSQAPRFYMNAPSVEDVRKQGQHQMILGAIEKKQTFSELINQANSMVTGVLHDTLKRSINVMPSSVVFGSIRTGTINEILMTLKNEDSVAHRITIKPVNDKRIVVKQLEYGIIAPGMLKQISVTIRVPEDEPNLPSKVEDVIQIVSKHDIFKVPVSATILSSSEFEAANDQNLQTTGKPIQNSRVRERLLNKIADSKEQNGPVKLTSLPIQK